MTNNFQSIKDLQEESAGTDDATAPEKFKEKQVEIKKKEIEKQVSTAAQQQGAPYINLVGFPVSPEALSKISQADSEKSGAVCFFYDGESFRLGTLALTDEVAALAERLQSELHCQGEVYLISETSFAAVLALYERLPKVHHVSRGVEVTADELNKYSESFSSFKDLQKEITRADVTQVVTMMLAAAVKSRASDIHIEGEEADIKIRFRVDGILHDAASLDKKIWSKVISRLKLLAKVKINVADKPQDGRLSIIMQHGSIDIRASFLPTAYGESVVMRLLDSRKQALSFKDLGLWGEAYHKLKREVERPNGMIITTGPTGSGKTTTLYSVLQKLNTPETKIITIEDPIEYQVAGINQSQTSDKYTFAKGLRSIVRQDPDVIMVGEIRDLETAEIAIQAALTGHLVLSTIHTNDASGTIPRLLSMGVKPFLLAPAINAMIGQRLVRRVCESCKRQHTLTADEHKRVGEIMQDAPAKELGGRDWAKATFYKGGGCETCQGLGYKGRVGIYEIMTMNADIEKLIQAGKVSEFDIRALAVQTGMVTMAQDGIIKAMAGITSVDEVLRVAE
jgi:type II secretory ATPase GspE/PulE/Tfp pilus assembly ATPase PilB-like protein